ncbi:MAG: SRPBCC domain-containing protein [Tetrasphaera sp.]
MSDTIVTTTDNKTGSVQVEDVFATDPADLWEALTDPERLRRWIAEVEGDLRVGGIFRARFTSGWEGSGEVLVCDAPSRLVVETTEDGGAPTTVEARLQAVATGTRLVIEERGIAAGQVAAYRIGWQVHVEDLGRYLRDQPIADFAARWRELAEEPADA